MMTENPSPLDLADRLNLIESMIAEGRRTTQRWAWTFLLWGIAYYVAIAWANFGKPAIAWTVTMIAAIAITRIVSARMRGNQPCTSAGHAIKAIWCVLGVVLFALAMSLAASGRADGHVLVAVISGMLATANGISSMILRWKMQAACAIVWLGTAIAACFVSDAQVTIVFLAAIFFCQIIFGIYGMLMESRSRKQDALHA